MSKIRKDDAPTSAEDRQMAYYLMLPKTMLVGSELTVVGINPQPADAILKELKDSNIPVFPTIESHLDYDKYLICVVNHMLGYPKKFTNDDFKTAFMHAIKGGDIDNVIKLAEILNEQEIRTSSLEWCQLVDICTDLDRLNHNRTPTPKEVTKLENTIRILVENAPPGKMQERISSLGSKADLSIHAKQIFDIIKVTAVASGSDRSSNEERSWAAREQARGRAGSHSPTHAGAGVESGKSR